MAMGLGSKRILALDWDRKHLRMVVVRPRTDGVDLIKAVAVPMGTGVAVDDPASLGHFIRDALRQAKIGISRVVLCIPRDQVVINSLNLPPTPESEMPALVQFQIAKELPFAAEQAVLDFALTGSYDLKDSTTVLVTAIREAQLDYYKKLADVAGLTIERIGLRPLANLLALDTKPTDTGRSNILLVEVGPQMTEIDIIREGRMAFSRAAGVALPGTDGEMLQDSRIVGPAVKDREQNEGDRAAVAGRMKEVILSFEAYRATEPAARVDTVIVAGASGLEPELATLLAGRFAAKTELFTPDKTLNLTPDRARELRGFSAVLGLALGYSRTGLEFIDFLHPKKPISKRAIRMRKVPAAVLTAALLLASVYLFHSKYIAPLNKKVHDLTSANRKMKNDEKLIRDFQDKVDALDGWQDSARHWPQSLANLTRIFPPEQEAFMTRVNVETRPVKKSNKMESVAKLAFRTSSLAAGNDLATRLREAAYLQVITGKEIGNEKTKDSYKFETSIDLTLPEKKIEIDALSNSADKPSGSKGQEKPENPKLKPPVPAAAPTTQPAAQTKNGTAAPQKNPPVNRAMNSPGSGPTKVSSPPPNPGAAPTPTSPAHERGVPPRVPTSRPAGHGGRP